MAAREAAGRLGGDAVDGAPLILCAHSPCTAALRRFVQRCQDPGRRLMASHSIELEPSQLLSAGKRSSGWDGPVFALVTPGRSPWQALRWAVASVGAGVAPAVVVCEVDEPAAERSSVGATAALVAPTDADLGESVVVRASWRDLPPRDGPLTESIQALALGAGEEPGGVRIGAPVSRESKEPTG
jgi:hypothetical protein